MTARAATLSIAFRAVMMAAGLPGLTLVGATAAHAQGEQPTAQQLANQIIAAALNAEANARQQGLSADDTQAAIEAAVSQTVTDSGADTATIEEALRLARNTLQARNASPIVLAALGDVMVAVAQTGSAPAGGGGGGAPLGSPPSAGGAGGGSGYVPPQ